MHICENWAYVYLDRLVDNGSKYSVSQGRAVFSDAQKIPDVRLLICLVLSFVREIAYEKRL